MRMEKISDHARRIVRIEPALDRFCEAHNWVHALEQNYHSADPFRWHLNAFLRAVKEVPKLVSMGLQNEPGFSSWYRTHLNHLRADPLIKFLSGKRDFLVHQGMLVPNSTGAVGVTNLKVMKLGLGFPINPFEDSDQAMGRYLEFVAKRGDFLAILMQDEDTLPCIERNWRMEPFDEEVIELAANALLKTAILVDSVMQWIGESPTELKLDCHPSSEKVRRRLYDRDELLARAAEIRRRPEGSAAG